MQINLVKKFLSLSVACAGLLMHGTDEHRQKDQYGYRALALIAHSARQIQTHAFKQVSNTASENIIPEVSGGNTQFPDCYNIS